MADHLGDGDPATDRARPRAGSRRVPVLQALGVLAVLAAGGALVGIRQRLREYR